jgi:hypothetical protein
MHWLWKNSITGQKLNDLEPKSSFNYLENTILSWQLWHKLYYFHKCYIFNKLFWKKTILWRKTSNCQEYLICQGENFKRNKLLNKHVWKLSRYSGYTIIEVVNWEGSTSGWNSFLINWLIDFLGMNLQDFVPKKKWVRQNKMKKKLWRRT